RGKRNLLGGYAAFCCPVVVPWERRQKRKRAINHTNACVIRNVTDEFSFCVSLCSFSLQACLSASVTAYRTPLVLEMAVPAAEPGCSHDPISTLATSI